MKLAKKISARITFCTILSIFTCIICWGGVTSCSNGSDDPEPEVGVEKTISDVDEVLFEATEHSVGSENTNIVFNYDRSEKGAKEKITIKNCDIEILLNDESLLTITNLDFTLNEYDDFTGDNATQYQCKKSIGKNISSGDTVKVVFKNKTGNVSGEGVDTAKIDTMTISLIDNDEKANWYKELVENEKEYQPLFPKPTEDDTPPIGEEEEKPNKEQVLYTLDFSGAEPPKNYYYDKEKFEANIGAKIEGAWNNFSIVPQENMNVLKDATYVKVTLKCSENTTFAKNDTDNNKFMLGIYKDAGESGDYAETNVRWTCFLNDNEDSLPNNFTTLEKEIKWEQKYDSDGTTQLPFAEFSDENNFRIWDCNLTTGTLYVQKIEFIKK
ncbi:MAG: hypothetical protein NC489_45765 [Ruminococcus flavefaciens]|nr:hypothetical protein [Ruminococcus flavefaciens]